MAIFEDLIEEAVEMLFFFHQIKISIPIKETLEVALRGGNLRRKVADCKQVWGGGGHRADNARLPLYIIGWYGGIG